jgi:hypothetical protein
MTERERALEWYTIHQLEFCSLFDAMAAFATMRVREELEAACKAVCLECEAATPLSETGDEHYFGFKWMTRDCPASPIRRRIAELEPGKLEAEK